MEALRERFGKYHVLEKIAQGGMAEVYKVKTVGIAGFEKIQALKRILPSSAREPRFIRSFIDEARIAVELTHRNIVQVFDFGKADGELFMAMELIEGKDLRAVMAQMVSRDILCPIPVAAYIIAEVGGGLDYAHRKTDGYGTALHIVHCDVSPSNVMLSTEGFVKILDFGIARASFASALERRRLRGKPRYMAPEQTVGDPPTAAADVFALGIIAWELFTGLPLYRGVDLKAILEAVRKTEPPRIDTLNPAVPREIVDAIATALSRDPAARGTAADLVAACARASMQASSRRLALWLAELDAADATSLEMSSDAAPAPPPAAPVAPVYVPRPSAPVIAPPPLGEGTILPRPSRAPTELSTEPPAHTPSPAELVEASANAGDDWPAGSVDHGDQPDHAENHASFANVPATVVSLSWDREPTAIQPRADLVPAEPTEPAQRYSSTDLLPLAALGQRASVPDDDLDDPPVPPPLPTWDRDDEPTSATATVPERPNATQPTADELIVESDGPPDGAGEPHEAHEPIDDDLAAIAATGLTERRRTVVVAALVEARELEVARALAATLGELAYQRGGVVVASDREQPMLVVAFGLEIAGEDDVAIAMGWAVDAISLAAEHDGLAGVRVRLGARTGVATSIDGDRHHIPSDAADEARALAREATPERPLFAGGADRLTSALYTLREVAPRRGLPRRTRVLEVLGPRGFDERARARLDRHGKFVGRAAPLGELLHLLDHGAAGQRRLTALVTGAAGVGKSRLVAELIARSARSDRAPRVISVACNPASRHAPFATVVDLYQASIGLPPARGPTARARLSQRLLHVLVASGMPDERARAIVTDLERATELRDGDHVGAPELADLRPRISAGLAAFRKARNEDRPRLTVIEDIHHADGSSLEVLRYMLAVPALGGELLVMTSRPFDAPLPAVVHTIELGDLTGSEQRALIVDRLGDAATADNIAAVAERAGGNPLFVEELASAVRDADRSGDAVPASARDVVAGRIDRLSPAAKQALRFAAVLGAGIRPRLIEELAGADQLAAELDELAAADLLVPTEADGGHETELVFARGLVREVVYDGLPARARRELHARVGHLLASRFFAGREEPPAVIADHLERGGELAGAAAFWLRAARLALAALDAADAITQLTRVLALERELGADPPSPASRARRREAFAGRELAHRLQGDLETDATDLDELEALCAGQEGRLADVALRRAQRLLQLGDYSAAHIATAIAEDHAREVGDDRLRGEALRVRAEVLERQGRFDHALAVVGTARELFAKTGAVSQEMQAMIGRGRVHLFRGHYEAAREAYRPVIARIAKISDPWLERLVRNHVALVDMCLGNFSDAMINAQRSLELCRRYGDRAHEGDALSIRGIILLEVGLYDEAAIAFGESLAILEQIASRWSRVGSMIYAGRCEVRRGNPEGLAILDNATAEAERFGAKYLEANALVTRAGARIAFGQLEGALADAIAGTAVAREATLVVYEIQGLARQALARSRLGAVSEAVGYADQALALLAGQRHLESSEEEVRAACVEVLRAAGDHARADEVRAIGRAGALRKLHALTDPAWAAAYAAIPETATLIG